MPSLPSLDTLRVLDAIDRRGSFAGAAAELHRVTSAVSYAVQKLEEELGVVLFDRDGHRARLTPTGQLVLQRGRELLGAAERLALDARQLHDGWETELRVAIDNIVEVDFLFPLLREFATLQPATSVRLLDEVLGGPWEALDSGRADIVIGGLLAGSAGAGRRMESLGGCAFLMCAAPDHPAARETSPLDEDALRRHPLIVVADSSRVRPALSIGLLAQQTTITVSTFRAKEAALIAGLGIGTLPGHRLRPLLSSGQLVTLPTASVREPSEIVMAWPSAGGGRARRWFLNRIPGCWRQAVSDPPVVSGTTSPGRRRRVVRPPSGH